MIDYVSAYTGAEHSAAMAKCLGHLTTYYSMMPNLAGLTGVIQTQIDACLKTTGDQTASGTLTLNHATQPLRLTTLTASAALQLTASGYVTANNTFDSVMTFSERILCDNKTTHPSAPAAGLSAIYTHLDGKIGIINSTTSGDYTAMLGLANQFVGATNKFGVGSNYTQFSNNGHMTMNGNATVFEDLVIPLTTAKQGAGGKPDFDYTNVGYLFDKNDISETLSFIVQLPHSWKEGSTIYPHLHFKHQSAGTPTFVLTYSWFNVDEAGIAPASTYTMGTLKSGSPSDGDHWILQHATNAGISGSGKTISSILVCILHRVNNSTPNADVLAYQLDFHYEKDSLGSNTEYTK